MTRRWDTLLSVTVMTQRSTATLGPKKSEEMASLSGKRYKSRKKNMRWLVFILHYNETVKILIEFHFFVGFRGKLNHEGKVQTGNCDLEETVKQKTIQDARGGWGVSQGAGRSCGDR